MARGASSARTAVLTVACRAGAAKGVGGPPARGSETANGCGRSTVAAGRPAGLRSATFDAAEERAGAVGTIGRCAGAGVADPACAATTEGDEGPFPRGSEAASSCGLSTVAAGRPVGLASSTSDESDGRGGVVGAVGRSAGAGAANLARAATTEGDEGLFPRGSEAASSCGLSTVAAGRPVGLASSTSDESDGRGGVVGAVGRSAGAGAADLARAATTEGDEGLFPRGSEAASSCGLSTVATGRPVGLASSTSDASDGRGGVVGTVDRSAGAGAADLARAATTEGDEGLFPRGSEAASSCGLSTVAAGRPVDLASATRDAADGRIGVVGTVGRSAG